MKTVLYLVLMLATCALKLKAETGIASWYGAENQISCTGQRLNKYRLAAAHKTLPLGAKVRVTSMRTRKSVIVVIEDRGPYTKKRIIDLNKAAAQKLGILKSGIARVLIEQL